MAPVTSLSQKPTASSTKATPSRGVVAPTASSKSVSGAPTRTLREGDTGPEVAALQRNLKSRGYELADDGVFGPKLRAAVERFQRDRGLAVDGVAGPEVAGSLTDAAAPDVGARPLSELPANTVLTEGSRGEGVRRLQQRLVDHGARLAVDGSYGPKTRAAVTDFQRRHDLTVDGAAGPETIGALVRVTVPGGAAGSAASASERPDRAGTRARAQATLGGARLGDAGAIRASTTSRGTSEQVRGPDVRSTQTRTEASPSVEIRTPDERSDMVAKLSANDFAPRPMVAPGPVEFFRVSPVQGKTVGRELVLSNVLEGVKKDGVYLERGTSWQTAMSTLAPRPAGSAGRNNTGHTNRLYGTGSEFRVYSEQIMKTSGMQVTTVLLPEDRRRSTTVEVTGAPTYQKAGGRDFGAIMAREMLSGKERPSRTLHAPAGRAIVLDRYDQPGSQGIMRDLLSDVKVKENGVRVVQFLAPREFFNENIEYRSPSERPGPQPVKHDVPIFDSAGKQIGTVSKGTPVTPIHEVANGTIKPTSQVYVQRFGVNLFGRQIGFGEDQRAALVALPDGRRAYLPLGKAKNIEDLSADELERIARDKPLDHEAHKIEGASHDAAVEARGLDGRMRSITPMTRMGRPSGIIQGHRVEQNVSLDVGQSDSRSFGYNMTLNKSFGANQELAPELVATGAGSAERNAGMYGLEVSQTARLTNTSGKARVAVLSMASPEGRWTGPQELTAGSAGFIGGTAPNRRTFAGPVEIVERDSAGRVISRRIREIELKNAQTRPLAAFRIESGEASSVEVRTLGQSMQYAGTVLRYRVMDAEDATPDVAALLRHS